MLIDPPKGVWVPSWLVYQVADLERETYRALLQVVGWLWVTKKHGGPLGTSVEELAARWGVGVRAVYARLQVYADRGYLEVRFNRGRVYLNLGTGRQQQTDKQTTDRQTAGQVGGELCMQGSQMAGDCESRMHETGAGGNNSVVVVVDSVPDGEQPQQPVIIDREVEAALLAAGVRPLRAAELAADPWVTVERVGAWVFWLRRDPTVRSVPAVLVSNLGEHWEPMPVVQEGEDRRRFVEGEYAAFIEH